MVETTRSPCLPERTVSGRLPSRELQLQALAGQEPLLMGVLEMPHRSEPQRPTAGVKAVERHCWELLPALVQVWVQVRSAWLPWVLRLHGFRGPVDGCLPWHLKSLSPARLRGSAPCPSSSRTPAPRRGGCRSVSVGPAARAAFAWREAPGWPGFAARARRGPGLQQESLQLLVQTVRMQ